MITSLSVLSYDYTKGTKGDYKPNDYKPSSDYLKDDFLAK